MSTLSVFAGAVWDVTLELAPWLLLGTAVAALLHLFLPADLIRRRMQGKRGVLTAVVLGVPLPLCSCGVIPAGIGLRRDGASRGSALGFLISTPQTGVDSVLVSASFLGWPFAIWKLAVAGITGVVGGLLTEELVAEGPSDREALEAITADSPTRALRTPRAALDHGVDILRSIWRWLVFGVLVSAAITTLVPPDAFAGLSGNNGLTAGLVALVISLPLYVCATASVPIAAAMVSTGLPAGAALVFLLAGPATNVATMGAIRRAFGGRTLGIYLGTLIVGSLAGGMLFDSLLDGQAISEMAHHEMTQPWTIAAALALIALLFWFAGEELRAFIKGRQLTDPQAARQQFPVEGMNCGNCVRKIESAVGALEGVVRVEVELQEGRVDVIGAVSRPAIVAAIETAGFRLATP